MPTQPPLTTSALTSVQGLMSPTKRTRDFCTYPEDERYPSKRNSPQIHTSIYDAAAAEACERGDPAEQ